MDYNNNLLCSEPINKLVTVITITKETIVSINTIP